MDGPLFSCQDRVWEQLKVDLGTHSLTRWVRDFFILGYTDQRNPRHLWTLGHLIRLMIKYDLTNKKTTTKTNTLTKTITNIFREHLQRELRILKTFREHPQIVDKLWNCCRFWQFRTSKHYNHSDLTIKSETGQYSQFLQCSFQRGSRPSLSPLSPMSPCSMSPIQSMPSMWLYDICTLQNISSRDISSPTTLVP